MIISSWVPTLGLVKKLETLRTVPPSNIYLESNFVLPHPLPSAHLSFLTAEVFQRPPDHGLVSTPAPDRPVLTRPADLLCCGLLLCSLHLGYTGFLPAPRMSSVCSCGRAFELAFSLPVMLFLQIYAWRSPSYPPRFCPNAIFSAMPALVLGLPIASDLVYFLPQHLVHPTILHNSRIYCLLSVFPWSVSSNRTEGFCQVFFTDLFPVTRIVPGI